MNPTQLSNFSAYDDSIFANPNETFEDPNKYPFSINNICDLNAKEILDVDEIYNESIYFHQIKKEANETKETKESTNTIFTDSSKKTPIFKTTIISNNTSEQNEINNIMLKKKRGRKPLKGIQGKNNKVRKQPRKYDDDNIIRKNQTHNFNYIQDFNNCLLKEFGIKHEFKKIDYCFKKKPQFEYFESLKRKTLGDILQLKISQKYTKIDKNHNLKICEEIKDLPVIKNVLKENYMTFFREVYYKSERKISLKKYGSDEILTLSEKINTYKDKVNSFDDKKYAEIYEATIRQLYINGNNNINDSCI